MDRRRPVDNGTRERESTPTPDLQTLNFIPVLDGFRGIAILLVVAVHNFGIPGGWAGVDLFFVLSGFLITRILLNTRFQEGRLRTFYARRFLRIFPIYYLTLLAAWFVLPGAAENIWWYALYLASFTGAAPEHYVSGLPHTWSLSIEELFYLIWPMLIGAVPRKRLTIFCASLLGVMIACRVGLSFVEGRDLLYATSPFTRGDGLVIGSLLALAVEGGMRHDRRNRHLTAALLAFCGVTAMILAATGDLSFGRHTLVMSLLGIPCITWGSAALVWWGMGAEPSSLMYKALTVRPLAYIGRISYGFYLYHVPILAVAWPWLGPPGTGGRNFARGGVLAFVALGLAALSWRTIEAPINRLKRYWKYSKASQ